MEIYDNTIGKFFRLYRKDNDPINNPEHFKEIFDHIHDNNLITAINRLYVLADGIFSPIDCIKMCKEINKTL